MTIQTRPIATSVTVLTVAFAIALAAMSSVSLVRPAGAQDGEVVLVPFEDPLFSVASVRPEAWEAAGNGQYLRGTPPQDVTAIVFQSAPASVDEVWSSLLPMTGRDDVPESTGSLEAGGFEWSLFRFPVDLPGLELEIEIALADAGGATHLIVMQAAPDEFDSLREAVFLPGLEAFRAIAAEATPAPDELGFVSEEVSFAGGADDVVLAGTLTLPAGAGPHPVIVLMNGSGAQDRDSSFPGMATLKPFARIAEALTPAGVATLRYDDRGVGGSSGDYSAATVGELAEDGRAAIEFLAGRADIADDRIGLLGHSEGGVYAATLAADDPRVAFVVALAAPAVPGVDLLIAQNTEVVRAEGASPEEIAATTEAAEAIMPAARDGDAELVESLVRESVGAAWDRADEDSRALMGEREDFIQRQVEAQLPTLTSDWYRSILAYDPDADWSRVVVPVLGIFGGKDVQVPAPQNEPALRASLEAAGNEDFETLVLAGANHLFQAAETGAISEYGSLADEFTPELLPLLVEWVSMHATADG